MPDLKQIQEEVTAALRGLEEILIPFAEDTEILWPRLVDRMPENDLQFWRRTLARLVISEVEAYAYQLKRSAYALRDLPWANFSPGELSLLNEESYRLDRNGTVKISKDYFLPMLSNFRFALACFCRLVAPDFILAVEGQGWEHFRTAVEIRNRITHPKSKESLYISAEEADIILQGSLWFRLEVSRMMRSLDFREFRAYAPDK